MEESKGEHHSSHVRIKERHHSRKKISWKKIGIVLGILIILVGAYFLITYLIKPKANVTVSSLKLDYTLKLDDGTIIAENISSFKPGKVSTFFGLASDKLDKVIAGLKQGESITVNLEPSDAFGEYNESMVIVQNRTQIQPRINEINRTIEVPLDTVKQAFNEDPVVGKNYTLEGQPFGYKVLDVSTNMVTLSQEVDVGTSFDVNEFVSANVTKVTDDKITLFYSAEEQTTEVSTGNLTIKVDDDNIYFTLTPEKGASVLLSGFYPATVKDYNETSVVFDLNPPYAGKKVIAEIKVVEITKKAAATTSGTPTSSVKKIEGAPNVEVFVMSYCPYGTQIEKGILPVAKLLEGKINFEIKFVFYAMHGKKELDENTLQYCIQKEQNAKFMPYLECFLESEDSASCLAEAEVDKTKMDACVSKTDEEFEITKNFNDKSTWLSGQYPPFNVYAEDNQKYGVEGSPALVINGEQVNAGRDSASLLEAICAAFTEQPEECNEELSSASPSPGFGSGTSSSGSAGGCGA